MASASGRLLLPDSTIMTTSPAAPSARLVAQPQFLGAAECNKRVQSIQRRPTQWNSHSIVRYFPPMVDTLTPRQRSERMSRVRGRNTRPEVAVRRLVHGMGFRYRLHGHDLPGTPDMVFASRKKVIFIHGCFWHRHSARSCKLARLPKSRLDFWLPKLDANRRRDRVNRAMLKRMGWDSMLVWECQISDSRELKVNIRRFLEGLNALGRAIRGSRGTRARSEQGGVRPRRRDRT
ncbi:MAG: DNA mismatch endonuclease Vsr [Alphaproteobacteria bacterium]